MIHRSSSIIKTNIKNCASIVFDLRYIIYTFSNVHSIYYILSSYSCTTHVIWKNIVKKKKKNLNNKVKQFQALTRTYELNIN